MKLKKEDYFESESSEDEDNEYSLNNISGSSSSGENSSDRDKSNKHFTSAITSIKSVSFQQNPEKQTNYCGVLQVSQEFALPHEVLDRK